MTISITASHCTYTGDGSTTTFDVKNGANGIYFAAASELTVTLRSGDTITSQSIGTHYTVSGAGSAAGTITFLTAPASGLEIRIERNTPLTNTLDLGNSSPFDPDAVEAQFDKVARSLQDLSRKTAGGTGTHDSTPMTLDPSGDEWDAQSKVIGGVADATENDHAVNYGQLQDVLVDAGAGNVVGPASATDSRIAAFDGTTGKLLKDGGKTISEVETAAANAALNAVRGGVEAAFDTLQELKQGLDSKLGLPEATTAEVRANTPDRALSTDQTWGAADLVSLTDAATIAVNMSLGINFTVTLGGNRTLGAPTNTKNGQSGIILVKQDGTGSRTLAYNAVYKWAGGSAPTLTTTASRTDKIFYVVESSSIIHLSIEKDSR